MNYRQAEQYILTLRPKGIILGMERINTVLAALGNPQSELRCVHISGTNGKGSTAKMIQSMLSCAGYRCGLFHSPVPDTLRLGIELDGIPVSGQVFAALCDEIINANPPGNVLTEFEFLTVAALLFFRSTADIAVIECGLGGRDDATNCIPAPLAAVFTPVSLDHTAILGDTVAEITKIKCGIIKPPCKVVSSPEQGCDALAVIMEIAAGYGLSVHIPSLSGSPLLEGVLGETVFLYGASLMRIPMPGAFQRANALTALMTVELLREYGFNVSTEQMVSGLAAAKLPLRQEMCGFSPLVILDGSHNPDGAAALASTLSALNCSDMVMICGMLADKNIHEYMRQLLPFCSEIICCTPKNERAMSGEGLAEIIGEISGNAKITISVRKTPAEAFSKWDGKSPLLAAGSFYTAAEIAECMNAGK